MSVAWVGAGISAVGAISSASAAKKAAKGQAKSAEAATAEQRRQYNQTRSDQSPFRNVGVSAINKLAMGLGLQAPNRATMPGQSGAPAPSGFSSFSDPAIQDESTFDSAAYLRANPAVADPAQWSKSPYEHYQEFGKAQGFAFPSTETQGPSPSGKAMPRSLGGMPGAQGGAEGAPESDDSSNPFFGSLNEQFDRPEFQFREFDRPEYQFKAFDREAPQFRKFGAGDFEADPGYQFRLDEGMKGINNSASARGSMLSGAALKAVGQYNQNFASNEYSNVRDRFNNDQSMAMQDYSNAFDRHNNNQKMASADYTDSYNRFGSERNFAAGQYSDSYNRFKSNQDTQYNRLASLAGVGQTATNQLQQAGQNMSSQVSNNLIGAGNAMAAGRVGSANAINGGISQAYNMYQNNRLMDAYGNKGQQPGMTGYGQQLANNYNAENYG